MLFFKQFHLLPGSAFPWKKLALSTLLVITSACNLPAQGAEPVGEVEDPLQTFAVTDGVSQFRMPPGGDRRPKSIGAAGDGLHGGLYPSHSRRVLISVPVRSR